jgi:hypothetical protein
VVKFEKLGEVFVAFYVSIQVVVQMLKYDDHMLSEFKAVKIFNNVFFAPAGSFLKFF